MNVWKFIIDRPTKDKDNPDLEWEGCLALVLASSQSEALERAKMYAALNGYDARWLETARCYPLPLTEGAVLSWVMM